MLAFIIFGTRGINSTIKQGDFLCPQCATERQYKHKKVTRFFTLYFIPLIPLGKAGEFVECQTCKGTFVPGVLDYDPNKDKNEFQSQYETAMRHSMILMMLADGHIDAKEKETVLQIINKFGHSDISMEKLEVLITEVERGKEPVDRYLSKISPSLNEHGKELIIKCGLSVASADENIDASEMALIYSMADAMQMSKNHLKGIIEDSKQEVETYSKN